MAPLYEQLDLRATRKAAKEHLKIIGKKVMHQNVMEYVSFTNSVIDGTGKQHSSDINKVLNAMEKQREDQAAVDQYMVRIINCINRLEDEQRTAVLGKYLYKWDHEEMERYMNKSISTIKRILREAEVDFALLLHCEVLKIKDDGNKSGVEYENE